MAEREEGRCKKWIDAKGFGFIRRADGTDLFCHVSQTGFLPLRAGQRVAFDVGENPRTMQAEAKAVSILDV
jgi:CspA family cold shock protein